MKIVDIMMDVMKREDCLIEQASDVPSIIFFIISWNILYKNSFTFFIYNFTQMKIKSFECPKSKPATGWVQSSVLIQRYGVNADESRRGPERDDALRLEDVEHGGVRYSRA